ncbi:MAG: acyl-CoA thioesterase [Pseudomonadota bacterium]
MSRSMEAYRGVAFPWHCDGMGHVSTRFYTGWFDEASYHLIAHLTGWSGATQGGLGWADVQRVVEYQQELHADDLFVIHSSVDKLGTNSLTTRHELRKLDGSIIAVDTMTSVRFNLETRRGVEIELELRNTVEEWLSA